MLAVIEDYLKKVRGGETDPTEVSVKPLVDTLANRLESLSLYEISEAFWMLTLLLWMKLKHLLPVYIPVESEEEEEEIEGEAYYDYSAIVEAIREKIEERGDFFEFNIHQEFEPEVELDLYSLSRAYTQQVVKKPRIRYVPEKITYESVLEEFRTLLDFRRKFVLQEHFKGKEKLSMAFFVSLELYRLMEVVLEQSELFAPITVEKIYRVLPALEGRGSENLFMKHAGENSVSAEFAEEESFREGEHERQGS